MQIISGKVGADHVHMFISYRTHHNISQIVQWLKGTSALMLFQEFGLVLVVWTGWQRS